MGLARVGVAVVSLVVATACAAASSGARVRRVVVDPGDAGYGQEDCARRCASQLKPGEPVRCELARFESEVGDALGFHDGLVCVIGEEPNPR